MDVNRSTSPPAAHYLILGSGRAASHFQAYLSLLGIPHSSWSRRLERRPGSYLASKLRPATHVAALVTDSAIEPLVSEAKTLSPDRERTWIHFSGSLVTKEAWGCHPLMTFAPNRTYDLETYRAMAFVTDKGAPLFHHLLPGLSNPHYRVEPAKKALYHALCVLSGNFTTLLWRKLFGDLESKFLIPRQAALPYLQSICENLAASPDSALTGPLARGDAETLARNIEALDGDAYQEVYRAFVRAYGQEKTARAARITEKSP
jgi:2-dehydropantoate 2-reductase